MKEKLNMITNLFESNKIENILVKGMVKKD